MAIERIASTGYRYPDAGELQPGDVVYAQPLRAGEDPNRPYLLLAKLTSKQTQMLGGAWHSEWETWACIQLFPTPVSKMDTLHISSGTYWMVRDE